MYLERVFYNQSLLNLHIHLIVSLAGFIRFEYFGLRHTFLHNICSGSKYWTSDYNRDYGFCHMGSSYCGHSCYGSCKICSGRSNDSYLVLIFLTSFINNGLTKLSLLLLLKGVLSTLCKGTNKDKWNCKSTGYELCSWDFTWSGHN